MKIDFEKGDGLVPVIIQDYNTLQVLMLGYMNEVAYQKTVKDQKVTFFSRSKQRLWQKGETSGNYLYVKDIKIDCDKDTILIKALPQGPTCHEGTTTCFKEETAKGFLYQLESVVNQRIEQKDKQSYTYQLYTRGLNKVVQKVGEEAVEVVIEAKDDNLQLFINEVADLFYHLVVLLRTKGVQIQTIEKILQNRHQK